MTSCNSHNVYCVYEFNISTFNNCKTQTHTQLKESQNGCEKKKMSPKQSHSKYKNRENVVRSHLYFHSILLMGNGLINRQGCQPIILIAVAIYLNEHALKCKNVLFLLLVNALPRSFSVSIAMAGRNGNVGVTFASMPKNNSH